MKKNTLRSLGIGFLSAAILTGAFAIFVQGNTPVEGIQISGLLANNNEEEMASLEEQINSLTTERDTLEETRNTLNESLATFSEQAEEKDNEISRLSASLTSLQAQGSDTEDETSEDEESSVDEGSDTETDTEVESATFEIAEGQSSEQISLDLEAAGFIESAEEFQSLLDEWNLHSVIQAGSFELDSSMTIHDIATIITDGAYLYY